MWERRTSAVLCEAPQQNCVCVSDPFSCADERQALHSIMKDLVALQMTRRQPVTSHDSGKAKAAAHGSRQVSRRHTCLLKDAAAPCDVVTEDVVGGSESFLRAEFETLVPKTSDFS